MRTVTVAATLLLIASCAPAERASRESMRADSLARGAELVARAIIPSNHYTLGPRSGHRARADNGVKTPFPGQPIPGFSAIFDAGDGTFRGMVDNGYGERGNSKDFLLRLYRIRCDFRTAGGGRGEALVLGWTELWDPAGYIPRYSPDGFVTGSELDPESICQTPNGDLWIGDEFGPFIVHADSTGRVLDAPFSLPGVVSPQNPFLFDSSAWTIRSSRGFEGMGMQSWGAMLYPILEGALRNERDPRRRRMFEFNTQARRYTRRSWSYRVDAEFPDALVGDCTAVGEGRFVLIERDDAQGAEARHKKVYLVDLERVDRDGYLEKRLVLDLLHIRDPNGISLPARPGEFGVGDPFSFPLQSVEALAVLWDDRLVIANDNNYPSSDGRWRRRDRPDDTEIIIVRVPGLR